MASDAVQDGLLAAFTLEELQHPYWLTDDNWKLSLARFRDLRDDTLQLLGPLTAAALPVSLRRLTLELEQYHERCGEREVVATHGLRVIATLAPR
jgi:hypothetical protein